MKQIKPEELSVSPITLFGSRWGILTAGSRDTGYNAMTIAWGSVGTLWEHGPAHKMIPVCNVYVRPNRFTYTKMLENDVFSVSFPEPSQKSAAAYLGSHSGRDDPNKIAHAGLTLVQDGDAAYIDGSHLVFICRKLYNHRLDVGHFADKSLIELHYSDDPGCIHEMFVGEIAKVLQA